MRDPELLAEEQAAAPSNDLRSEAIRLLEEHEAELGEPPYRSARQRINAAAIVLGVGVFAGMLAVWACSYVQETRAPRIHGERVPSEWRAP